MYNGLLGSRMSKLKGFKMSDKQAQMLRELAQYMGTTESEVLRYLIWKEYNKMKKEMANALQS
jgi:predicted DNA-binding protein